MATETTESTEWSTSKKIVIFSIVGVILLMAIVAFFIPTSREYITNLSKLLLEFVKVFAIN